MKMNRKECIFAMRQYNDDTQQFSKNNIPTYGLATRKRVCVLSQVIHRQPYFFIIKPCDK
jgi:hypothetical protein